MPKPKSLLVSKSSEPKSTTFSFRVAPDLATRAARVKSAAEERGLEWRIGEALADHLATLVVVAEKELATQIPSTAA